MLSVWAEERRAQSHSLGEIGWKPFNQAHVCRGEAQANQLALNLAGHPGLMLRKV